MLTRTARLPTARSVASPLQDHNLAAGGQDLTSNQHAESACTNAAYVGVKRDWSRKLVKSVDHQRLCLGKLAYTRRPGSA